MKIFVATLIVLCGFSGRRPVDAAQSVRRAKEGPPLASMNVVAPNETLFKVKQWLDDDILLGDAELSKYELNRLPVADLLAAGGHMQIDGWTIDLVAVE